MQYLERSPLYRANATLHRPSLPNNFIHLAESKSLISCTTRSIQRLNGTLVDLPLSRDLISPRADRIKTTVNEIFMLSNECALCVRNAEVDSSFSSSIVNELLKSIRELVGCLYALSESMAQLDLICSLSQYASSSRDSSAHH